MTDIQRLRVKLGEIDFDKTEMIPVNKAIKGAAFFPGGRGLWNDDDESISNKKVMILGQGFDNEKNFEAAFQNGKEDVDKNRTWVNLRTIFFKEASVQFSENDCFFTNAFLGLRKGDSKNTGCSPGFKSVEFLRTCREFFKIQLEIQQPKVVFVLGLSVIKFLLPLSEKLKEEWKDYSSIKELYKSDKPVLNEVRLDGQSFSTKFILITHPSFWHLNVALGKRRDSEIESIRNALNSIAV